MRISDWSSDVFSSDLPVVNWGIMYCSGSSLSLRSAAISFSDGPDLVLLGAWQRPHLLAFINAFACAALTSAQAGVLASNARLTAMVTATALVIFMTCSWIQTVDRVALGRVSARSDRKSVV